MGKDEIDEELAGALKQAKNRRMYFAFVVKGGADGALIVSKQKVPPTAIAEAKKKCGGSAVIKGACFGEDGKLVFETAKEPAATLGNALKLVARRDTGMTIAPVCRMGTNPDLADDDAAATPGAAPAAASKPAAPGAAAAQPAAKSAAPAAANLEAAWNKKLADITPALKTALAQKGELAERVKGEFAEAQGLARGGKFADAIAKLDKMAGAIGGGAQPAAQSQSADPAALWNQKLAKITPDLKTALAAGGDSANRIKAEFAAAQGLAQKNDYTAAIAKLDQLAAELQKPAGGEKSAVLENGSPAADPHAQLIKRLNALAGDLKKAIAEKSPQAADLQSRFTKINGLVKSEDFAEADGEMTDLEDLLAGGGDDVAKGSPVVPIWQTAHDLIAKQFISLQGKLAKSQDDQLLQISKFGLKRLTKKLDAKLEAALSDFDDADSGAKETARGKLQTVLVKCQKQIENDPILELLDDNPFGVSVTAKTTFKKALRKISLASAP